MTINLKEIDLDDLSNSLVQQFRAVQASSDLELLKRDWLGKDGTIKQLFKQLKELEGEEKARVAACLNELKNRVEEFIENRSREFQAGAIASSLKK